MIMSWMGECIIRTCREKSELIEPKWEETVAYLYELTKGEE